MGNKVRLISDVHGVYPAYWNLIKDVEYSIQLGDMGFDYSFLRNVDPEKHIFFKGNHDNHDVFPKHCINDYGVRKHGGLNFFFVQGAYSLDWKLRVINEFNWGKSWWENEELSMNKLEAAIELYTYIKPDLVLTHEAPHSIIPMFSDGSVLTSYGLDPKKFRTRTSMALQAMFEIHQPKAWYFGHHHVNFKKTIGGTKFTCMEILGYEDVNV